MIGKLKYNFFTSKEIKPTGWIRKQLEIQRDGLCGNLDKILTYIRDSKWIGKDKYGGESFPYWLDGYIPLVYLLDDKENIKKVEEYMHYIFDSQLEDGWIVPERIENNRFDDSWSLILICKVITVYADCSGDERAVGVLHKALKNLSFDLVNHIGISRWGSARWGEALVPIFWLYEKTNEEWLIDLALKLKAQGYNWETVFKTGLIDKCDFEWDFFSHVVNVAMMLKFESLYSRISGEDADEFAKLACDYLDSKHSTAAGHFTGDENLAGDSPLHGTELCSIVEAMYSYEHLFSVSGNTYWGDRLEKIAFNALPATISPDMWSHQYVQMSNQIECTPMQETFFRTDNNESHIFGLIPNCACCAHNHGQGWPKLVLSSFMKSDEGITSFALVPSRVTTKIKGTDVSCELITEYPFRNRLVYVVDTASEVDFTLSLRIPSWAETVTINGERITAKEMYDIKKVWNGTEKITVMFEYNTKVVNRPEGLVCVWHGPLLYTIGIEEKWDRVEYTKDDVERKFPYCDYRVTPKSKWNYGLCSNEFKCFEQPYSVPFSNEMPPVYIIACMAEIEWGYEDGHCSRLPVSTKPIGEQQLVKMIPYGCSNLRMTEIPYIG